MTLHSLFLSASSWEPIHPSLSRRPSSYGGRAPEVAIRARFVAKWFSQRLLPAGLHRDRNCPTPTAQPSQSSDSPCLGNIGENLGAVRSSRIKTDKLEARGVEPLSSSLSAQTSTRLSGD